MYSFQKHYRDLLSFQYVRVYGGYEKNMILARKILSDFEIPSGAGRSAIDLGAGPGFYSIPLAESGYCVLAVDLDAELLKEIIKNSSLQNIKISENDIVSYNKTIAENFDLAICMTDVISHFDSYEQMSEFFNNVFESLKHDGLFLLSFRDQSKELIGCSRFLPFFQDESLIATTVLDFYEDQVEVTDLYYMKENEKWEMKVGSYRKLRLFHEKIMNLLQLTGFSVSRTKTESGMMYLLCKRQ